MPVLRRLRERPFLALALFTLVVGALWHLSGVGRDDGPLGYALFAISYVLGAPFIAVMRLVGAVVTQPAIRGALGLVLGLLPYLAADEALRRRRLRKQTMVADARR